MPISNVNSAVIPAGFSRTDPSDMYQIVLDVQGPDARTTDANGRRIFPVVSPMPETFNIGFSADWETPGAMQSMSAGGLVSAATGGRISAEALDTAAQIGGIATRSKWQSFRVWTHTSPLSFSFECQLNAQTDSDADVRARHMALLKLVAPRDKKSLLVPPGPTVVGQALSKDSTRITLKVGRYLFLDNVVVDQVSSDVQSRFDALGNPISVACAITVSTFFSSFTQEDIEDMFKAGRAGSR